MKNNIESPVIQGEKESSENSFPNTRPITFSGCLVLAIVLLSGFGSVYAQQQFTIKGKIEGLTKEMRIRIAYNDGAKSVRDSTITTDGNFVLNGTIVHPGKASISLGTVAPELPNVIGQPARTWDDQTFYLTNGITTIKGKNIQSAVIDNPIQQEYILLNKELKPFEDRMLVIGKQAYPSRNNKDSANLFRSKKMALYKAMDNVRENFVITNPDSYVSFDVVSMQYHVISDPVFFETMFQALSSDFQNSAEGKKMGEALGYAKRFAIGQQALAFTQNDTSGNPVSLASLKGKYVLIDFWASWCGPCRMEYPFLRKAYEQFKNKNFQIIGVSLDDKKTLWTNAIKANNFTWLEVCDLKGHQNEVVKAYGINAIPQSLLLDPQGFIIAKNLRGDDLVEKLNEIINTTK